MKQAAVSLSHARNGFQCLSLSMAREDTALRSNQRRRWEEGPVTMPNQRIGKVNSTRHQLFLSRTAHGR